ncbi:hypothetical protein LCGC14_3120610 [marine sediment metagenome]|uniref:Uncharacterized protein n=1 Tax=marine sediment metagenome TaxID=412755 RepID=A0A0F8Y9X2_9ZZZZ
MINANDIEEISKSVTDVLRVRSAWTRVNLTSDDLTEVRNFITSILSKYEDNTNITNRQYNPKTNETEEVVTSNKVALKDE